MNNFEKIKTMTLDKMAEWLAEDTCSYCAYQKINCNGIKCENGIKQWLQ